MRAGSGPRSSFEKAGCDKTFYGHEVSSLREPFLSLDAAMQVAIDVAPLPEVRLSLQGCGGRVLASPVEPCWELPRDDLSVMDGFAVGAMLATQAMADHEQRWRFVGQTLAGQTSQQALAPGTCVRVTTGSVVPEGTYCVLPQEVVALRDGELLLAAEHRREATFGRYVRRRGSELGKHELLLSAGTRLEGPHLALAAAAGHTSLGCHATPRIGLTCTGDELVAVGSVPREGQIVATHGLMLGETLARERLELVETTTLVDDASLLCRRVQDALRGDLDVLIISGGMSVGAADHTRTVLEQLDATCLIGSVQARPGRLALMATLPRARELARDLLVFGLPGNPGSAHLAMELLVMPCIRRLTGRSGAVLSLPRVRVQVPMSAMPKHSGAALEELVRARIDPVLGVIPLPEQSSGALRSICGIDLLLRWTAQCAAGVSEGTGRGSLLELDAFALRPDVLGALDSWHPRGRV